MGKLAGGERFDDSKPHNPTPEEFEDLFAGFVELEHIVRSIFAEEQFNKGSTLRTDPVFGAPAENSANAQGNEWAGQPNST